MNQRDGDIAQGIGTEEASALSGPRRRMPAGPAGTALTLWLVAMSCFHLYTAGFGLMPTEIHRAVHLLFVLVAVFVLYPAAPGRSERVPWYDWLLAILGGVCVGYLVIAHDAIMERGALVQPHELWLGLLTFALVLEAGRRVTGNVLPCIAVAALLYCFLGRYMPGILAHKGFSLSRVVQQMYLTTEGILGIALGVSSTYVFLFILFGAFLGASGGARFFNDLALSLAGRSPGGPAKVAVVASGLLGTINGSSVANVATTGTFTIPLMKKIGCRPEFAAAVEATASTGGQLMPPIMGAGAFIMTEFLGVSYLTIAMSALFPAILYYLSIYCNVDFNARRNALGALPPDAVPNAWLVLRRDGHLLLPVIVVIALLLRKYTPLTAAFWGVCSTVACSALRSHTRMSFRVIIDALADGAREGLGVAVACALVGFVVGTAALTGVGLAISNNIVGLAGGSLVPTLFFSMTACLVLGMGLPTTANYIVTSTVVVPALAALKVPLLAAHLFVFYFGILADVTPPVCLASFTAAGIAGANPSKTGRAAFIMAIPAFIVPYAFVYSPEMLLQGTSFSGIALVLVASVLGVVAIACAAQGWCFRNIGAPERAAFAATGLALLAPFPAARAIGLVALAFLLFRFHRSARRTAPVVSREGL